MKKILLFAAVLCGLSSFAVDPVAVWSGDFDTTEKTGTDTKTYTLAANGNSVAADGSTITISAEKGVSVSWPTGRGAQTTIVKVSGLKNDTTNVQTLFTVGNGSSARVGVTLNTDGTTKGIWGGNLWYDASLCQQQGTLEIPSTGSMYMAVANAYNGGTHLYEKTADSWTRIYQANGLQSSGDSALFKTVSIGGSVVANSDYVVAEGMMIEAIAVFDQQLSQDQIAAYEFPQKESSVTPVLLINIGTTTAVDGWLAHNQTGGEWIPTQTTKLSQGDVTFQVSKSTFGGNFSSAEGFGSPVTTTFESGSYSDVFGKRHDSIFDEIKTSLGLSADITESIYTTGVINGGQNSHIGTIGGLDASAKYIVYVGQGYKKKDGNDTHSFKIDTDGYATVEGLDYAVTVNGTGTAKNAQYTSFDAGATLQPGINGLLIVRMKGIVPKEDGTIAFSMPTGRSGLNFLAVAKVNESKPTSKTFEIAGEVSYDNLATEGLTSVTLNLTADATVTFTKAVSANLTFTGAYNLTVKGGQHLTWANITDSGVTGTRTYEISGSYTAADGLKNKIKADTTKATYVFKGTDNNGATLDFGNRAITSAIASHLVFEGGTGHSLTIGVNNGNTQLASDNTADTPFILVKGGTTLTVTTNWMTGYSLAFSSNSCIVRVNDGGTLKFNQDTTRVWYNGQLYLDPGATIDLSACGATRPDALGFNGGVLDAKQQIYIPATADGAETGVVKITGRSLGLASDGTAGCGIFVGKNSRLEIEGFSNDSDKPAVSKYGEGELRISGNVAICNNTSKNFTIKAGLVTFNGTVSNSPVIVESGASLSGSGTISSALTLQVGSSIVVDPNSRLTASSSLTLANPINLICTPQQGLTVIVPPSGFAGTGYKATLNGSEQQYDLYLEDGALKLKFKTPPSFTEDIGAITAVVANGKGGTVEVDISKLQKADYADSLAYTLKFGDVIVGNPEESDGKLIFTLDPSTFKNNTVYRGEFILNYEDGEIKSPIAVYEGEKTFVMMEADDAVVIREQGTINDAAGETISVETKFDSDDYIDTCDSEYTVSISASEAVEATADGDLVGDEQGGVRIAEVNGALKLQIIDNGVWTDFADAAVDTAYTLTVKFHYNKGEGDEEGATSVIYTLDKTTKNATNKTDKLKVTEVFISDGTVLPNDLIGLFQLDKAVVADVEIVIDHDESAEIEAKDLDAAQAIADKMVVAISEEVAKVVSAETYRGYFKVVAKQGTDGKFHAVVEFAPGVQEAIEDDIETSMEKVVAGFGSGSAEIAAKPGLYYGVKRGETLNDMDVRDPLTLAGSDGKVTITITKPNNSSKHFYRIICSPTPATK